MFTYFTIVDKLSKSQFYSNRSEPIPESIASKPVDIILAADCVCLFFLLQFSQPQSLC